MKIYFTIEVGLLNRGSVRTQLNNAKNKLEFWYPECEVLLVEDKGLFDSEFYFEANKLPDSAKNHMQDWLNKMKKISQEY
jgi:hypothetical protein